MEKDGPAARQLLYCNLMSEIKCRLETIAHVVGQPPLSLAARYEFGYLQLRMICEVMAIACLTAHGDVIATEQPRLRRSWSAGEILNGLEKLHADFYPEPAKEVLGEDGRPGIEILKTTGHHLSKYDLMDLYNKCGDVLHRGNLKNIAPRKIQKSDLVAIGHWHGKIINLLNSI